MKRPRRRRTFQSEGDELNYLSDVIQAIGLTLEDSSIEREILLGRFQELLASRGSDDGSIMLQDHWAVFHEASSNFGAAIGHRLREIELIHELFAMGGAVGLVDLDFLLDKLRSLQGLYSMLGLSEESDRILGLIEETKQS